ncbi:MAG: flavodoxin family protein [Lachnospiraceae bacterium]|nr:flavodoxin family protein [Lachnospiraceae bacterium]
MKVLAVSSSPRKEGNSDVLCDRFLQGAKEAGHETEKISLGNKNISPCAACYGCGKSKACVKKDDMGEILEKLIEADVIVLATPVYFYSMSAQMKTFIDRCLPRYKEIRDKAFYYIVTAADPQHSAADETISGLRGFLRCLPGAEEKDIVYGTGTWDMNDVYRHPSYEKVYETGKNCLGKSKEE